MVFSALAEEKFKEVQEAYDQIMKQRENGGYSSGQSYSSGSEDDVKMQAACNYINARHYREALNVLSSMSNQNAHWYYCSAIANYGVGNNLVAMEHAQRAASMEPGNPEYTNLVNQFQMSVCHNHIRYSDNAVPSTGTD